MNNYTASFKQFSVEELGKNGDNVRKYASQNENLLLKSLAESVIEASKD